MNCETFMLIVGIYFACKVILLLLGVISSVLVASRNDREHSSETAAIVEEFLRKNRIEPLDP